MSDDHHEDKEAKGNPDSIIEQMRQYIGDPEGLSSYVKGVMGKFQGERGPLDHNISDIFGISQGATDQLYTHAQALFQQGQYGEANKLFSVLILATPDDGRYQFAYGASAQKAEMWLQAIYGFKNAAELEPGDPLPLYHLSHCYLVSEEHENARQALIGCIERCGDLKEYEKVKERATLTLKSIKETKKKAKPNQEESPEH
ncbi:MAG: CesD/SycD/LcrH family type III secretion system chaperone [Waddliaceae bacterium]|nr:CesD/SycD/LcrH family type III secretion system chaperone [Waddliaceae bacterium]